MSKRIFGLVLFVGLAAPAALACWDNTDLFVTKLKKTKLTTEQLAELFDLQKQHRVVVNRALPGHDLIDRFCEHEQLEVLAHIPFRRKVAAACAEGALAIDVDTDVAEAMRGLHQALLDVEVAS